MSIATFKEYKEMLNKAHKEHYAFPAVNVANSDTANAVIEAFAKANCDGIVEISPGGGKHNSGALGDEVLGTIALAEHVHRIASKYDVKIALHTDHCPPSKVDSFLMPLIEETKKRRAAGLPNLFNSHMFDGCELPLEENMNQAEKILKVCAENEIILEIEAGVVGGEEDGVNRENVDKSKLYTTPEDMVYVYERLSKVEGGNFMFAATFGNVHGVYKPGNVVLTPKILRDGQKAVTDKYGNDASFWLVFHGGSGSSLDEIHETLEYGVIKMNIDTDTQYTFTRPIVDHLFKNYDGALKLEGEVGNKKVYDPRKYLVKAKDGMRDRVIEACETLKCAGKTINS